MSEVMERQFELHLKKLGLKDESEYGAWCKRNGFSPNPNKSSERLQKKVECYQTSSAIKAYKKKKLAKNPKKLLEACFKGEIDWDSLLSEDKNRPRYYPTLTISEKLGQLAWLFEVHTCLSNYKYLGFKETFHKLLSKIVDESDFFNRTVDTPHAGKRWYINALANMAICHSRWVRPIEDWKPDTHNTRRQFSSLLRHLFAKYDVPTFLEWTWFTVPGDTTNSMPIRYDLYIHVGSGQNIRTARNSPKKATKKIAHYFLTAPDDFSIEQAWWWGDVLAIGGDERLAHAVAVSKLRTMNISDFWDSVIRFFVANPMLDRNQVGPIIDFIYTQKFENTEVWIGQERRVMPPLQPNFSMQGRTAESLINQMERWHRQLGKESKNVSEWNPSGIAKNFILEDRIRHDSGNAEGEVTRTWRIVELNTSKELNQEGRKMLHCVGSYSGSCARGVSSIWSLRCEDKCGNVEHHLTIELETRTKRIIQCQGKRNQTPLPRPFQIMRRWASLNGLSVPNWMG